MTRIGWLALVVCACGIAYGSYVLNREINYRVSYEDMVRETIREMVKAEALKETE